LLVPHMIRTFMADCEQMGTTLEDHRFVVLGALTAEQRALYEGLGVPAGQLVFSEGSVINLLHFFGSLDRGALLVFHGIFSPSIWTALFLAPTRWKRTAWVMWGGDIHAFPAVNERWTSPGAVFYGLRRLAYRQLRRTVIRRLGAVAGVALGDFDVVQSHCGKLRNYRHAFYSDFVLDPLPPTADDGRGEELRICLGNSATPSNGHLEALQWLSRFKHENIKVVCPLSYGDARYADSVVAAGRDLLGDRFQPLLEVMEREQWVEFLKSLDILVFNHNRQQGIFALCTMLFAGKKCFVRSEVSVYSMLREFGIRAFPTEAIASLSFADFSKPLQPELVETNRRQCQQHLSRDASARAWKELFAHFRQKQSRASGMPA